MATNYVSSGDTVTLPAPTGGSIAGDPQVINDLAVMPMGTGPKGTMIVYCTGGEWLVRAAVGMKAGQAASVQAGGMVAAGVADSSPYGKLTSDTVNGYASVLIVQ